MSAVDYLLKIPYVEGGATIEGHEGDFIATGYEFDLTALLSAASGGGSGAGTINFSPLIIDLASTPGLVDLLAREAGGVHLPTVTFTLNKVVKDKLTAFETITLSDVTIASYDEKSGFDTRIALSYGAIQVETKEFDPTGAIITHDFRATVGPDGVTMPPPAALEAAVPSAASIDYLLKIPDVEGGSTIEGHEGDFIATGYEFDLTALLSAASGGSGAGTINFSPLIIDLASTPGLVDLLAREAGGVHLPTVTFTLNKVVKDKLTA